MSIIDSYSAEKDKLVPPPPEKEQGPTLVSVLHDPKDSALFGALLKTEGADANLMNRLADAKLDAGDMAELEKYRTQFFEKKEQVKMVNTVVTRDTVKDFAKSHPELQQILNMVGPDKAVSVLQAQMARIAMEEPTRFQEITDKVIVLQQARERTETLNKDIEEQIKKLGIDGSSVAKILAISSPSEREDKLTALVKARYEALGKIPNWKKPWHWKDLWTGKTEDEIDNVVGGLEIRKAFIDTRLDEVKHHMGQVGEVLALDMNNNEDLRHALAREIVGDKRPLEEKNTGFKEVRDCLMSDETLSSEWETYKSTENGWATKTDVDKKAARDKFADDYKKKREEKLKKGKGFWTGIFGGIFSMYTIDDAKKDTLKL